MKYYITFGIYIFSFSFLIARPMQQYPLPYAQPKTYQGVGTIHNVTFPCFIFKEMAVSVQPVYHNVPILYLFLRG